MLPKGGNGGLSLRNIEKIYQILSANGKNINLGLFLSGLYFLLINKRIQFLKIFINACAGVFRDAKSYQKIYNIYEDAMISIFYAFLNRQFRTCPASNAIYFSVEVNAEEIISTKLKCQLPFGIHGYDKYLNSIELMDHYRHDHARIEYSKSKTLDLVDKKKTKNKHPLITIITATYNLVDAGRVESFRRCLESIHSQTYPNIEHVIIDGASNDGTLDIIQEYVSKGVSTCYTEKDQGVWDAMYKGQERARGEFINIMNSDDYFSKNDAVQIAVDKLMEAEADWFYSNGKIVRQDGSQYDFPTQLHGVFNCIGILHQTMFIRTNILRAINPFRTSHVTRENYLMMTLIVNNVKHAKSNESLVCYQEGGFSSNEYGGLNVSKTKSDFGAYCYALFGRFWGLSEEECSSLFCLECFSVHGIKYSYLISKKLQIMRYRYYFRFRLAVYVLNNRTFSQISKFAVDAVVKFVKRR
jgi:glycosyltransferase involved in cell wall biosynthesis